MSCYRHFTTKERESLLVLVFTVVQNLNLIKRFSLSLFTFEMDLSEIICSADRENFT